MSKSKLLFHCIIPAVICTSCTINNQENSKCISFTETCNAYGSVISKTSENEVCQGNCDDLADGQASTYTTYSYDANGNLTGSVRHVIMKKDGSPDPSLCLPDPTIAPITVVPGEKATLTVTTSGYGTMSYQWLKGSKEIAGATQYTYTIDTVTLADDTIAYRCRVQNSYGEATTNPAVITVSKVPVITAQPKKDTVAVGDTLRLSVSAKGVSPFSYQWYKNGIPLEDSDSSTYITQMSSADTGTYYCKVTNDSGSVTSSSAKISASFMLKVSVRNGTVARMPTKTVFYPSKIDTVRLIVSPASGYRLWSWDGDTLKTSGDSAWVAMDDSKTISAIITKACLHVYNSGDVVNTAAYSHDGTMIVAAVGGWGHKVDLVLIDTAGQKLFSFDTYKLSVTSAVFSSDDQKIMAAARDSTSKEWSTETHSLIATYFDSSGDVWCAAYSPDGDKIISGGRLGPLKEWSTVTGELLHTYIGHTSFIHSVCYSPDGSMILSSSEDSTAKEWSTGDGSIVNTFQHSTRVLNAAYSSDGSRCVSVSSKTLSEWSSGTGEILNTYECPSFLHCAAFSPNDSTIIAGTYDGKIIEWSTVTHAQTCVYTGHTDCVNSVMYSPDGKRFVSGAGGNNTDQSIRIWTVEKNIPVYASDSSTARPRTTIP